jgi:hypothetical protein
MRILEKRSVEETAAALGLTAEQVWYRQHRQVRKLRALYRLSTAEDPRGGSLRVARQDGSSPEPRWQAS